MYVQRNLTLTKVRCTDYDIRVTSFVTQEQTIIVTTEGGEGMSEEKRETIEKIIARFRLRGSGQAFLNDMIGFLNFKIENPNKSA